MFGLLILVVIIFGFFYFRKRIVGEFTDPVTHKNRKRLGGYLLILIGAFFLLLFWIAASSHP